MTTTREIFTVHTWRFIEYRFLPACSFDTSAEAWAWAREQMDLGKDMSRFRVIASNPILPDPDAQVMAIAPAATCAGAVNLRDAMNERNAA